MTKIANFFKSNYELINYVIIAILAVLASFFYEFSWVLIAMVVLCASFYSSEKLITLFVVMHPMKMLLLSPLFVLLLTFVATMFIKNYLISIFKNRRKISIKVLLIIAIFMLYGLITHIFAPYKEDGYFIFFIVDLLILFFIYEERANINVVKLVKVYASFVILTGLLCVIGYGINRFDSFNELYFFRGLLKNFGMTENPNIYAMAVVIAISSILVLFYFEKISLPTMVFFILTNFVLGYLTVARNFLLTIFVVIVCFSICYFIKNGLKSLEVLLPMGAIVCLICLIFSGQTELFLNRVSLTREIELDGTEQMEGVGDHLEDVFAGRILFNPGRINLWKLYFKRIFQSPLYAIFGLGVSAVKIGQMHAHNAYVYYLYKLGIVGILICCYLFYTIIKSCIHKTKNNKKYDLPFFAIQVLPFLVMMFFDNWDLINVFVCITLIMLYSINKWKSDEQKKRGE